MVRYGKGIANNASHFIQLLVLAFGAPEQVQLLSAYLRLALPTRMPILFCGLKALVYFYGLIISTMR